jgi:hypothetical protein
MLKVTVTTADQTLAERAHVAVPAADAADFVARAVTTLGRCGAIGWRVEARALAVECGGQSHPGERCQSTNWEHASDATYAAVSVAQ